MSGFRKTGNESANENRGGDERDVEWVKEVAEEEEKKKKKKRG